MHNTISKNIINFYYTISCMRYSTSTVSSIYATLNKILLNQNLAVTNTKLEELLKVQGVELNLPLASEDKILFENLTGKSKYKGFFGVYIFIHKSTGKKYVGSSNLLRRRMEYYFKISLLVPLGIAYPLNGKFLPLLIKEGLCAFKLIIYKLNKDKFSIQDALILEQYFLLSSEFNLNTTKIVNFGPSKGKEVYVYDLTCNVLHYQAKSWIELKRVLKIHPETSRYYVDSKLPYLNDFFLLSYYIPTATISNISIQELVSIMQEKRKKMYLLGTRRSIPVILEIKKENSFVKHDACAAPIGDAVASAKPNILNFNSITSCINYLRELGIIIKRDTLTKYIKKGKVFHHFLCKYSDKLKNVFDNFKEVGLIIDEYKNLNNIKSAEHTENSKSLTNRKNKPILVKGLKFSTERCQK